MKRTLVCLLLLCTPLFAAAPDAPAPPGDSRGRASIGGPLPLSHTPIEIEADSVDLDEPKGESIYRGNVKVRQGDLHMQADTLNVQVKDGKIERLTAEGRPVQMHRDIEPPLRAQANRLDYYIDQADQGRVVIQGQAHVWQGLNEFSGEHIEYLIEKALITAVKGTGDDTRVRVILHPQQNPANSTTEPGARTDPKPGAGANGSKSESKPAEKNP